MRYTGNLAYKLDYTDSYAKRTERNLQVKTKTRTKPVSKNVSKAGNSNKKVKQLLTRSLCIVILSAAAAFMITQYVRLDALDREARALSKEVETLRSSTSQKIIEMDQGLDLEYIEKKAIDDLNMQRPEKYQQIYVDVKRNDVTAVTANEAESPITLGKEFFAGVVGNIVDYFSIR